MKEEYYSIYNFLCSDSHSDKRALISRHVEIEKEDFNVVLYSDTKIEDFLTSIDSTSGLLVDASIKIHDFFKTESLESVQNIKKRLQIVRKETIS